jgi:antitoxin (DNA-binding transcriptional repressor) of toxin-antitoxin stability system
VIEMTDQDHPIARIVPPRPGMIDQLVLEGRASPGAGDLLDCAKEIGLPAASSGLVLPSAGLAELRAHER